MVGSAGGTAGRSPCRPGPQVGAHATRRNADPLARLFGDESSFRAAWGRSPLLHRAAERTYDDVLTLDDVDSFVSSSPRRPTVRMVIDGDVLAASQYCTRIRLGGQHLDDVVDVRKVVDRLCDGATLVLQSLHRTVPAVGRFVDELQCAISHPVQANAYLTPPGTSGLAEHADDHDVIAVQLHGDKHWWVEGLGDVTLRAGDSLYVPARTRHSAATSEDTSLHLTLGIIRVTARDVVERILRAPSEPLDRPLPIGYQHAATTDLVGDHVQSAIDAVVAQLSGVDVAEVVEYEQHRQRRRPQSVGHVTSMAIRHRLTLDSTIRWTAPEPLAATLERHDRTGGHWDGFRDTEAWGRPAQDPDDIEVHLGDRAVTFPIATVGALRRLSHGEPTRVGDLPGLDEPSRLVLANRLVEESACVIVAPVDTVVEDTPAEPSVGPVRADRERRSLGRSVFRAGGRRVPATGGRNPAREP